MDNLWKLMSSLNVSVAGVTYNYLSTGQFFIEITMTNQNLNFGYSLPHHIKYKPAIMIWMNQD